MKKNTRLPRRLKKKMYWLEKEEIKARYGFDNNDVYLNLPAWMPFEEYAKLNNIKDNFNKPLSI